MKYLIPIQTRLPIAVAAKVREHCTANGIGVGAFLRLLVMNACDAGLGDNQIERSLGRIETDQCFTAVALDALLAGHPDPEMRTRAHAAFTRKIERRRIADAASGEGEP
jgi:hypothetical protein